MFKGQPETGKQQPENIQQKRSGTAAVSYFLSKGEKTQRSKFKTLQPNRYAQYRNTPEASCKPPAQPAERATKKKPQ